MTSLGDSGLPVFQAGHCDWQRPHSVQVAKSRYALPGEVLDLAAAEVRIVRRVLEVDGLAVGLDRQQRAQAVGQPLEGDVDRRQEDVQVLGVQHDQQEDQRHGDVREQRERLDPLVGGVAQRVHQRAHARGRRKHRCRRAGCRCSTAAPRKIA